MQKKKESIQFISLLLLSLMLVVTMIPLQADAALAKPKITQASNDEAGGIGIMFNGVSNANRYQIVYSKNKNFSNKKTIDTTSTYYGQIFCLEKGTYYVKMRAYVTSNGKEVFSGYSNVKKVKVNNGATKISLGKEKSGKLSMGKPVVAFYANFKTSTWVKFKISAYANDSSNPKSEWCFTAKQEDWENITLMNTDDSVVKHTINDSPYYTYTSPEPLFIPVGEHSFKLNVLEYMFEDASNYELNYKITIIETDRPFREKQK